MHRTRDSFTHTSLLTLTRQSFASTFASSKPERHTISSVDCLMSALAVFSLKYPSLLQFDQDIASEVTLRHNLWHLYGVKHAPCDTSMRERLDGMELGVVRHAMKEILARLQRGKVLERWKGVGGHYLISLDGTGFFSSNTVHCHHCCEKHHRNGTITYHHQMVVGSIVHPDIAQVLPIDFEPIAKHDGDKKNDCERNASKRWLEHFRRDHPQLSVVVVADGLSANDPFISTLEQHRCHYILVCQKDDHAYLWDWFNKAEKPDMTTVEEVVGGIHKRYRFMKNVPLNGSSERVVNVVHYQETLLDGKTYTCGWVTDLEVTEKNVRHIVKGGRARWKIENETFNTLKNQGYHFEHNYGHGYHTLANLLAGLMLLAFLLDQCLEAVTIEFQQALTKTKRKLYLWQRIQSYVLTIMFETWEEVYECILSPPRFAFSSAV